MWVEIPAHTLSPQGMRVIDCWCWEVFWPSSRARPGVQITVTQPPPRHHHHTSLPQTAPLTTACHLVSSAAAAATPPRHACLRLMTCHAVVVAQPHCDSVQRCWRWREPLRQRVWVPAGNSGAAVHSSQCRPRAVGHTPSSGYTAGRHCGPSGASWHPQITIAQPPARHMMSA